MGNDKVTTNSDKADDTKVGEEIQKADGEREQMQSEDKNAN
jgi:hypothetical protein